MLVMFLDNRYESDENDEQLPKDEVLQQQVSWQTFDQRLSKSKTLTLTRHSSLTSCFGRYGVQISDDQISLTLSTTLHRCNLDV